MKASRIDANSNLGLDGAGEESQDLNSATSEYGRRKMFFFLSIFSIRPQERALESNGFPDPYINLRKTSALWQSADLV